MFRIDPVNPLARLRLVIGARELTLGTLMERLAAIQGDRRLVTQADGAEYTYADAARQVSQWAGSVKERVDPEARVVLALPNSYDQLLACLAVSRAGAIPVPVNDRMRAEEIDHVIEDSGADLVVRDLTTIGGDLHLDEAVPVESSDVAALFYTSGTTGKPKGAELTHRALVGGVAGGAAWPGFLRSDEAVLSL